MIFLWVVLSHFTWLDFVQPFSCYAGWSHWTVDSFWSWFYIAVFGVCYTHTHTHTHTHTCIYTQTNINKCTHAHAHTLTHKHGKPDSKTAKTSKPHIITIYEQLTSQPKTSWIMSWLTIYIHLTDSGPDDRLRWWGWSVIATGKHDQILQCVLCVGDQTDQHNNAQTN